MLIDSRRSRWRLSMYGQVKINHVGFERRVAQDAVLDDKMGVNRSRTSSIRAAKRSQYNRTTRRNRLDGNVCQVNRARAYNLGRCHVGYDLRVRGNMDRLISAVSCLSAVSCRICGYRLISD